MMADATDSAPPNVPSRVASLRVNHSAPHLPLTKEDSVSGKGTRKKDGKKSE